MKKVNQTSIPILGGGETMFKFKRTYQCLKNSCKHIELMSKLGNCTAVVDGAASAAGEVQMT